jgi:hypothetical protein
VSFGLVVAELVGAVSKIRTQNWSIYQHFAPNTIFETNCKTAKKTKTHLKNTKTKNPFSLIGKCANIAKKSYKEAVQRLPTQ